METSAKSFTSLIAWQKAHQLVILLYRETKKFPREEIHSLTDQMRRAVVSISSNLAEGFNRQGKKEKIQFYFMALGSLTEIQNQLLIARDIGYMDKDQFDHAAGKTVEVSKLINGLIKSIKNSV
jgi:four helix bundle protein